MDAIRLSFEERLAQRSVSRRQFLGFCASMAATLGLAHPHVERIAKALASAQRPPLLWLEFQDCTGDTESFLRASNPSVDDLLLEQISADYHETLIVPAGEHSELSLHDTKNKERRPHRQGRVPARFDKPDSAGRSFPHNNGYQVGYGAT